MTAVEAPAKVTFYKESLILVRSNISSLLTEHWWEIAHYRDIGLNPDWATYEKAEAAGLLRVFTARERLGEGLIGYAVFFVHPNLHYKQMVEAKQDILFIRKDKRGFGRKFIQWCDEQLRGEGVQVVFHHVKDAHDFSPMLKRIGYELVDHIYARRLF